MRPVSAAWQPYELSIEAEKRMFDVQHDLALTHNIRETLSDRMHYADDDRLLVTMSVCASSAAKLRGTIPHLFEEAEACGLQLDMIIGMNFGAKHAPLIRQLVENRADIVELFTCDQVSEMDIEPLFDDPYFRTDRYLFTNAHSGYHRVHIINQLPTSSSKGKNRMLKPIYDGIQQSILEEKWVSPPRLLLEVDDESRFFSDTQGVSGLGQLVRELKEKKLDAIGARIRSSVYRNQEDADGLRTAVPDPDAYVQPEYRFIDECQIDFYRVMAGGGTLGMTDLLTAVRWPISHRYPGARCDDLLRTMLINEMQMSWGIAEHSYVYNECRNTREQLLRWLCGGTGIMKHLGKQYIHRLVHDPYGSPNIWKKYTPEIRALNDYAKENPESLTGSCDW